MSGHVRTSGGSLNVNTPRPHLKARPTDGTREPSCIIHGHKWNCSPPWEKWTPPRTLTHLTWPSAHARFTSFGPYKSPCYCRRAYRTTSRIPADGPGRRRLVMSTVWLETVQWMWNEEPIKASRSHLWNATSALEVLEFYALEGRKPGIAHTVNVLV